MGNPNLSLELKPVPDGYGFIYGELRCGDEIYTVNIMPPASHWDGDIKLDGHEPHATDWGLYADGEEIGRVAERHLVFDALATALLEG